MWRLDNIRYHLLFGKCECFADSKPYSKKRDFKYCRFLNKYLIPFELPKFPLIPRKEDIAFLRFFSERTRTVIPVEPMIGMRLVRLISALLWEFPQNIDSVWTQDVIMACFDRPSHAVSNECAIRKTSEDSGT